MTDGAVVFETERFLLRELCVADAEAMFALNADPEVIRYTDNGPFASVDEARRFLEGYADYRRFGMGRWVILDKRDERFLGWCGLKRYPESGDVDLGYRLFQSEWGRGIATETARGSLVYGFEGLGLRTIAAHAAIDNIASIRVLEKLGMRRVGATRLGEHEAIVFTLDAEEFRDSPQRQAAGQVRIHHVRAGIEGG